MAHRSVIPLAALLACLVLQTAASPVNRDVLNFLRPGAADLQQEVKSAGRKLQQTFEEPALPFTFDGFGFGYGGIFPAGGAFNGLAVGIYNILFRDILNSGLQEYLARGISNNPINPLDYIPPEIGDRLNRDVVQFFGFDYFDRYFRQYWTPATASVGKNIDGGCTGPVYSLKIDGGSCEIMDDHSVECTEPSISLKSTALTCNLPYRSAASLKGEGWQYRAVFGRERKGEIGPPAGLYNFGAAVNITSPYLGFTASLNRVANDFGVQQWYQFVGNLVLNELLRIQAALLSGSVDDKIATAERAQRIADATNGTSATDRSGSLASGVNALASASTSLMQKIAARMGLSTKTLETGLKAAGVLKGSPSGSYNAANTKAAQPTAPQLTPKQRQQVIAAQQQAAAEAAPRGPVLVQSDTEREGDANLLAQLTTEMAKQNPAALQTKKPAVTTAPRQAQQGKAAAKKSAAKAASKP